MKIKAIILCMLLSSAAVAAPPVVSFSVTPASGPSPVTPKATWSSSGASTCNATASPANLSWLGDVGLSGTKTLDAITVSEVFSITCSAASDNVANLGWIAPTTNTDGTLLTDLAGFRVYEVFASGPVLTSDLNSPLAVSLRVLPLSPGLHTFYVTAYKSGGAGESAPSNSGAKTIVVPETTVKTATVTPSKTASPPTMTVF